MKPRLSKKGFTLIEVLTAVVFLTIGMMAVHQAISRCVGAIRYSEDKLFCSFLVEEKIIDLLLETSPPAKGGAWDDFESQYQSVVDKRAVQKKTSPFNFYQLQVKGTAGCVLNTTLLTPTIEKKT